MCRTRRTTSIMATLLLAGLIGGCDGESGRWSDPPTPAPSTPRTRPAPTRTVNPTPRAEIWQWALGRNVWTDPGLRGYTADLGRSDTDVNVLSQGFQLTLDASGVVVAVTLYNDETMLGLPASQTAFRAYRGTLPAGLSWAATAASVQARYGAANQSGGFGTDITFSYRTTDGYLLELAFAARHESDLPSSPIHCITVRRG